MQYNLRLNYTHNSIACASASGLKAAQFLIVEGKRIIDNCFSEDRIERKTKRQRGLLGKAEKSYCRCTEKEVAGMVPLPFLKRGRERRSGAMVSRKKKETVA